MKKRMIFFLVVSVVMVPCVSYAAQNVGNITKDVTETETQTFDFDIRGVLELEAKNGNVQVEGTNEVNTLVVQITKYGKTKEDLGQIQAKVDIGNKDTEAKIKTSRKDDRVQAAIDYKVRLPRFAEVKVKTKNGNVNVQNVTGQQKVETTNGNVDISGVRKETEVRTENGTVMLRYASDGFGKADVKTKNGNVVISNAGGSVSVQTENGSVQVSQRVLPNKDDIAIKTTTGGIEVSLPKNVNARVKAETKMGSIGGSTFPWERKEQMVRPVTGDEARLTLGKGFASVDLASKTGSITLQ